MEFFSFLALVALAVIVLGPAGFFLALGVRRQFDDSQAHIARLELRLAALESAVRAAPPTAPSESPAATPEPALETPVPEPVQAARSELPSETSVPVAPPPSAVPTPRARGRSFEEVIGGRWSVWVGGFTLALGALLLVRYSIEQGLFGPGVRVLMGLGLAALLVAAGEWLRRRERATPGTEDTAYIPGVLTGAGAVAAFAAIYAAHALYGFIGPGLAMLALGATGLACLYAAALHGPALAGLGLLASFATPLLVSLQEPSPWPLVIYLAAVASASYVFARLRKWLWLALATATAAGGWGLFFALFALSGQHLFEAPGLAHLVIQAALASYVIGIEPYRAQGEEARLDRASHAVMAVFALLGLLLLSAGRVESAAWTLGALALAAVIATAGLASAALRGALVICGLFLVGALWVWPAVALSNETMTAYVRPREWRNVSDAAHFLFFAALPPLVLAAATARPVFTGAALSRISLWIMTGAATVTPLLAFATAYARAGHVASGYQFAAWAAALGVVFVAAATMLQNRLQTTADGQRTQNVFALGAAASATLAALALALVAALEGGTLTVALALAALGAAHVSVRLQIPALRWCVAGLGVAIAARLAWDPRIVGNSLGATLIFNWLLFGYGVPALAFGLAARVMRRAGGEDRPVQIAQALCILLSALLVLLEIRHGLNDGDIYARRLDLMEAGLQAVTAFGFASVLTRIDAARSNRIFRIGSLAFGVLAFATTAIDLGFVTNPLFTGEALKGSALFNALVPGYLLPAIAALVLARTAGRLRPLWYLACARVSAMALAFAFLSLEVRRLWQGDIIHFHRFTSEGELYTYSAVWLVFGALLLVYGLWRGSREVRLASAAVVVLTVLKVFLIDLSHLEGLLRAVSFIALGLALIGIGLVYQRFVFARPAGPVRGSAPDEAVL